MFNSQNLLYGKRKYLFGFIMLSCIALLCAAFGTTATDDFDIAKTEVLLRRIGHEVLLQSGDSTSRVLPVQKISENEYRIRFEKELTFQPASLVTITDRLLVKAPMAQDYVVTVLNCDNSEVTYGYSISENKKDDIVACVGREQPKACYMINVKFKPTGIGAANNGYLLGGLPFLALIGFFFLRTGKPQVASPKREETEVLALGNVMFDAKNRTLVINQNTTDLTATETRLLLIFALSPDQTIERSRLQKEIWEDEGVVVGRSLDMFISKLRKKLEPDPNINIVVIRGKGYKLETGS
ncbi:MAG: winged helix-turn-helix domain-containing protein [Bacteroidia bacterium]